MKLLVLLPRFPYPLDKGDKLRAYHQIAELAKQHEVYLFALSHTNVPHGHYDHLNTYCTALRCVQIRWWEAAWGVIKAFLSGKPLQLGYWTSRRARKAYAAWERQLQPDVVYCQMVRTIPTVAAGSACRKILDFQDALSLNTYRRMQRSRDPLRWLLHYEYRALQRVEQQALRTFTATTVIAPADQAALAQEHLPATCYLLPAKKPTSYQLPAKKTIHLVPNGVDTDYFKAKNTIVPFTPPSLPSHSPLTPHSPLTTDHHQLPATRYQLPAKNILFTGNMSYAPNVDAARCLVEEIMPLVWNSLPDATLLLAGADPAPAVRALAAKSPKGRVVVSGRLPDIRTAYAAAQIFVAPMRIGTGMQNKLLEAMSMQLPCVTTPLAASPLGAHPGSHLLVGDSPAQLAKQILLLLSSPTLCSQLADAGRRFVQEHYSWPAAVKPLERLLTQNNPLS